MTTNTLIFGHRGYPERFMENSLDGFIYAIDHGVEGLEFDVHLTKDNVPVIMHDERINRTTNGTGRIRDYTLEELRQYRLKDGQKIPTLRDLLTVANQQPVHLNLEFKTNKIHYPHIEQIVLEMVRQYDLEYPVIYSSFNLESLEIANRIDPNQQYCLLSNHVIRHAKELILKEHLAGLHLSHYQPLGNIEERIWTVDDPKRQAKLLANHVAGIITDNFEAAERIKNSGMMATMSMSTGHAGA
ncbi:glycerophosphoryl diester phosphodiesterase [Lentilactobacillus fungorum]|jgi:glycerophosphoryl diester phosphodiesterase|uniref:Glycerophosphoryl diester phosphodiesterase n=1 Tax=Lentilactobacillus fungorum TaxID=2201250 RepID=A0ABQ3W057_9LACO|nr:glycerophosphodiester phosphodiesterase family protein [Lentilactobacillus fungorum]GHP13846.1 glycerophosphoryl diester phosphodiesterase [Lentilactobacillus fungorum]